MGDFVTAAIALWPVLAFIGTLIGVALIIEAIWKG